MRACDAISVPVTVGFKNTVVLLPPDSARWNDWKWRAVLAHEFAHIERGDTWIAALATFNRCVFWFHPLAWWLKSHLAKLAERAADDVSVLATGDRERYAGLLLEVASNVSRGRRVAGVAMARSSQIGDRIQRILDESEAIMMRMSKRSWLVLLAAGKPVVYAAGALQLTAPLAAPQVVQTVPTQVVPLARSRTPPPRR